VKLYCTWLRKLWHGDEELRWIGSSLQASVDLIEIYTRVIFQLDLTKLKYSVINWQQKQRKGIQFQQSNGSGKYVMKFGISEYLQIFDRVSVVNTDLKKFVLQDRQIFVSWGRDNFGFINANVMRQPQIDFKCDWGKENYHVEAGVYFSKRTLLLPEIRSVGNVTALKWSLKTFKSNGPEADPCVTPDSTRKRRCEVPWSNKHVTSCWSGNYEISLCT
jgi:hypothetical protein